MASTLNTGGKSDTWIIICVGVVLDFSPLVSHEKRNEPARGSETEVWMVLTSNPDRTVDLIDG